MATKMTQPLSHKEDSQLSEQNNVIHVLYGCQIILNTSNPLTQSILATLHQPNSSRISTEETPSNTGYDECGIHYSTSNVEYNHKQKKIQDILNTFGVMQQITAPIHQKFLSFDERYHSFDKCLNNFKQDKDALCKAGFFYAGNGKNDHVLCFYCSKGVKDWEENDDPWTEHARWSETCSYMLLNKGKKFVDKIVCVKKKPTEFNQTESFKLMADQEDTSIFENSMTDSLIARELDNLKISDEIQIEMSSKEKLNLSQKQVNNALSDSIICIVCSVAAIEIAFIPCCHVACIQCTLELLCVERPCPVCRMPFSMTMRIYVTMEEVKNQRQLLCSSPQCLDEKLDPVLCKVCKKEKMKVAFLPCKHVFACVRCATEMQECPVCTQSFWATIQVYL